MINNEFHIIGVATSNFTNIGNGKYVSYILKVEVEKLTSKYGANFTLEVVVYESNNKVDVGISYLGKQVAVNGYLDSFQNKDGQIIPKIIAQNILILDNQTSKVSQRTAPVSFNKTRATETTDRVEAEIVVPDSVENAAWNNALDFTLPANQNSGEDLDEDLPF